MPDEYIVPEVLREVRRLRRIAGREIPITELSPSGLYAKCEEEAKRLNGGSGLASTIYRHAFLEAGWVGPKVANTADYVPYKVCPTCGYVF